MQKSEVRNQRSEDRSQPVPILSGKSEFPLPVGEGRVRVKAWALTLIILFFSLSLGEGGGEAVSQTWTAIRSFTEASSLEDLDLIAFGKRIDGNYHYYKIQGSAIKNSMLAHIYPVLHFTAGFELQTAGIQDGAITEAKLALGCVTYTKLNSNIVDDATIELDPNFKVKDNGITSAKILDNTITWSDLSVATQQQIQASGGGTINNAADDSTTKVRPDGKIYVYQEWLNEWLDSLSQAKLVVIPRVAADGVTDDAAVLQEAINSLKSTGGEILIPTGTINFESSLDFSQLGSTVSISFKGLSKLKSVLSYNGPTNTPAMYLCRFGRFEFSDFRLTNATGNKTTTIGIKLTSESPGSQTGPGEFNRIHVDGFWEGISVGEETGEAASEIYYKNIQINNNKFGITLRGSNSLNHNFEGLFAVGNGVVLLAYDPDCVFVKSGSMTGNTICDFIFKQAGEYSIEKIRTEGDYRFAIIGDSANAGASPSSVVTIKECHITTTIAPDSAAIILGKSGNYTIMNNRIQRGNIKINPGNTIRNDVLLINNSIYNDTLYQCSGNNQYTRLISYGNNRSVYGPGVYFPDENFLFYFDGSNLQKRYFYEIDNESLTSAALRLGNYRTDIDSLVDVINQLKAQITWALAGDTCNVQYSYLSKCDPSLAGYWTFNEGSGATAFDYSPTGDYDLTMDASQWGGGKVGTGLIPLSYFINLSENTALNVTRGTIACWLYIDNSETDNGGILGKGDFTDFQPIYNFGYDNNRKLIMYQGNEDEYYAITANTALSKGTWYLVAATWSADSTCLYINGVLDKKQEGSYNNILPNDVSDDNWQIGNGSISELVGKIDQLRVYNRELSAAELLAIYNEEN